MSQTIKVVIVGEAGVGKTSFLHCAIYANPLANAGHELMPIEHQATIGVDFIKTTRTLTGGRKLTLRLWDTAGEERFDAITRAYFRGATIVFLMFDVSDMRSFEQLQTRWLERVRDACRATEMPYFVVIGNKIDLKCVVSDDVATAWARTIKADYFRTTNVHSNGNYARTTLDIISAHLVRSGVVAVNEQRYPLIQTSTVDLRVNTPAPRRCEC